ncbi:MAG: carboxypeptidase-like regulatory domain-containing protein, partial [Bacteroidales bacterium]
MNRIRSILIIMFLFLVTSVSTFAQRSGVITGLIIDGSANEPLAFANIYVKGTSIGTVTDEEGNFRLDNVPSGEQTIVISFIGFADQEIALDVSGGQVQELETLTMMPETIMGEEVVVTAIMRGQVAAINKQLNSNTIVNVVSKDKIEDVPDVNAAESISRLPGITISRSAGEGSKVTVRGVSPRFNSITVNGLAIPATGSGDRSVDLSMVSSDILEGIEVYKALTPDMDADAIGGSVNLLTRTADPGFQGRVQLETGYHGLIKNIGTYKGSLTLGNRFLNNRIGILGTATFHRANRNSDEFDASYIIRDQDSEGNPLPSVGSIYLINNIETRDRLNASFTADYKMDHGKIVFDYFYTQTNRDILTRNINISPGNSSVNYGLNHRYNDLSLHSFQLRGEHDLNKIQINYSFSHSRIINDTPVSYGTGVEKSGAFESNLPLYAKPQEIPPYVRYELDDVTGGDGFGFSNNQINDRNYTGQLDLKVPLFANEWLNGYIKAGGKIRQKNRDREINSYGIFDGVDYFNVFIAEYPDVTRLNRSIYVENFMDPDFEGYTFSMGSQYVMPYVFDDDLKREHYDKFSGIDSLWWKDPN